MKYQWTRIDLTKLNELLVKYQSDLIKQNELKFGHEQI